MAKNPVSRLVIGLIHMYQKHISPKKGYGCAYRLYGGAHTGCSGHGLKVFHRFGIVKAWKLLRRRFDKCAWHAYQENKTRYAFAKSQRGECDCGAVDCPTPDCHMPNCHLSECHAPDCMPSVRHCSFLEYFNFCDILNGCDCNTNSSKNNGSQSQLKEPVASKAATREEVRREKRRLKNEAKEQKLKRKTEDGVDLFR